MSATSATKTGSSMNAEGSYIPRQRVINHQQDVTSGSFQSPSLAGGTPITMNTIHTNGNGLAPQRIVTAVALHDNQTQLISPIKLLLEQWHIRHGNKSPPVASSYKNETRAYQAFGPYGERFRLLPYKIQWAVTYGIWVLQRPNQVDVAVKFTTGGQGKAYYNIWLGDERVEETPAAVKIFQDPKTGEYPFVFEKHARFFGLEGGSKVQTDSPSQSMTEDRLKRKRRMDSSSESEDEYTSSEDERPDTLLIRTNSRQGNHTKGVPQQQSSTTLKAVIVEQREASHSSKKQRQDISNTKSTGPKIPDNLCFYFTSPGMEEVRRTRFIQDCSSAAALFEQASAVFGFFDKITELRCLSCKIKDCDFSTHYILDTNELDFQMMFYEIEKLQKSEVSSTTWSVEVKPVIL